MRVLVGIPLTDPSYYAEYRERVVNAIIQSIGDTSHEIYVPPSTTEKSRAGIIEATNTLVHRCLVGNFDYLWIVEGDVEVPYSAFRKLLSLDADVALGCYPFHDRTPEILMAGPFHGYPGIHSPFQIEKLSRDQLMGKVLEGFVWAGIGCALIKRRVFERGVRFRGYNHDLVFLWEVENKGFLARLHVDVVCGHLPEWPLEKQMDYLRTKVTQLTKALESAKELLAEWRD